MIRRYGTAFRLMLAVIDAIVALGVGWVAAHLRFGSASIDIVLGSTFPGDPTPAILAYMTLWPAVLWTQGLYRLRARWTARSDVIDIARAAAIFAVAILSLLYLFKLPDLSRALLLVIFPLLAAAALVTGNTLPL